MEKCKRELFGLMIAYIVAVIAFYVCRFGCSFSSCNSNWANFGSYFGGMLSIISIVLLYCNLREQRKENYRLKIEAGYNRLLSAIQEKYKMNKSVYKSIIKELHKASIKENENDINSLIKLIYEDQYKAALIIDLFNSFAYLCRGIEEEKDLDEERKMHYLQNLVFSLPNSIHVLIICHVCLKNKEKYQNFIKICKDYRLYCCVELTPTVLDKKKDEIFNYSEEMRRTMKSYLYMMFGGNKTRSNQMFIENNQNNENKN